MALKVASSVFEWEAILIVSYPDQKQLLKKKPELIAKKKV